VQRQVIDVRRLRCQCVAEFPEARGGVHLDLHLGDDFVQPRIRKAAIAVIAVTLAVPRRQHGLQDEDRIGGAPALPQQVQARVQLLELGEVIRARLCVDSDGDAHIAASAWQIFSSLM